jgi:hypothetical protein
LAATVDLNRTSEKDARRKVFELLQERERLMHGYPRRIARLYRFRIKKRYTMNMSMAEGTKGACGNGYQNAPVAVAEDDYGK